MYDVLVVSGAGIDTIVRVETLRELPADSVPVPPIRDYVAHTGHGYARGFHALGLATKFIDFLGEDPAAELILAEYHRLGLDFAHLVSAAGTQRAVNLVDDAGRRLSFFDGRHPDELRLPRQFYLPLLEQSRHVHLSITNVNRDMFDDIDATGASSSTDLHDWDGRNPHHREYAHRSQLVFLSAAALGERREQVMRSIREHGRAQVVVATDGAAGCHVLTVGDGRSTHFPAVRPDRELAALPQWRNWSSIDSNGAGDAFATGFVAGHLAGESVAECVTAGAICGAFACRSPGMAEFIDGPTLAEARRQLGRR